MTRPAPDPDRIAAACAAIRAGWDRETARRRAARGGVGRWEAPRVRGALLGRNVPISWRRLPVEDFGTWEED